MSFRSLPRFVHVLAVGAAAAAAMAASPARALELTVEIDGARNDKGFVSAALYNEAAGWMKQTFRAERVAAGTRVRLVFRDLPAGTYALAVIHDENGNGRLDSNVVGMPTEPYGFSRDARGAFGPPKFEEAVMKVEADTVVKVKLQ